MIYGYARVSTTEQDTALQLEALHRAGAQTITEEKRSGVKERPQLEALLSTLKNGDKLLVWKIDRFGRSLVDILRIIARIESVGATFASCTEPIDSSSPAGRMMMQMLGVVAEFERSMIRERSIAGQKIARENGIHCGRPRSLEKEQEAELVRLYQTGLYTMQALATRYDIHISAVKRAIYRVTKPNSTSLR